MPVDTAGRQIRDSELIPQSSRVRRAGTWWRRRGCYRQKGAGFSFTDLCSYPKPYLASTLPIHVGGSSRAAARRAGRRGDGYFPGGMLSSGERAAQLAIMRSDAFEAGRDPDALEYTRWGSLSMSAEDVEARAREGVTRLIVAAAATDLDEQRDELSGFADRIGLSG